MITRIAPNRSLIVAELICGGDSLADLACRFVFASCHFGINFHHRASVGDSQMKEMNMNVCPSTSESPLPKTPRLTESGYRVVAVFDSHDAIEVFPDTADGLQRAVQLAKFLCRSRSDRCRLCSEGRLDDPETIMVVQRFHTEIEVLGLFSPQENPDFHRFGHMPAGYDPSAIATVLSTQGEWSCLEVPEDSTAAREAKVRMPKLEPLVQSLEAAVHAAASQASLPSLADFEQCCSESYELFERLYEVGQQRTLSLGPDDFVRTLLTLPQFDAESARQVAVELDGAQRQVTEAVADSYHSLASELPEEQRDRAKFDLRVFIYEVLLSGLCDEAQIL